MALLFSLASCDNGSTSGGNPSQGGNGSQDDISQSPDIDYSLGTPPDENLKIPETDDSGSKNFSAKADPDGILIEFNVPAGVNTYVVNIDGIGGVARFGVEESTKADFFYPFVDAEKEYTVRIELKKPEGLDSEGYAISDETVHWFETKATAGARSKGEVRITSFEEIALEPNGNFRITKKPTFKNESLLGEKWELRVEMFQGTSWNHPNRRTKWGGVVIVPCTGFDKTYNIHSDRVWHDGLEKVDFVGSFSAMNYEHNGKTYEYRWGGAGTIENVALTPESQLWKTIDISNQSDVAKIVGTWKYNYEGDGTWNDAEGKWLKKETTLIIDSQNVTEKEDMVFTTRGGNAFADEIIKEYFCYTRLCNDLQESEDEIFAHEEVSFSDDSEQESTYKYKIYILYSDIQISPDKKTITEKYSNEEQLPEYFSDKENTYDGSKWTRHYDLNLFADGSALRITVSGTNPDGTEYKWHTDYKKQ